MHRLDLTADHCERGAQLVAEVGEQTPPPLVFLLESGCHPVEGGADRTERPRANLVDPDPCLPVAQPAGGVDQFAHRSPRPPEDKPGSHREPNEAEDRQPYEQEGMTTAKTNETGDEESEEGDRHQEEHAEDHESGEDVTPRAPTRWTAALPTPRWAPMLLVRHR